MPVAGRNRYRWGKLTAALLLLAGTGAITGCRKAESGEVAAIVIGERLPRLADPLTANLSPADLLLVGNAAQGLVRFDPAGNIAPGLAERWAVSDDGLSYVFRLQKATWSDGRRVRARDLVQLIERQLARRGRDPLRDTLGAVREVVAMTDRVIAIELSAPRPHLLQLLAQPEFGLVRGDRGTGPFAIAREKDSLVLTRTLPGFDGDEAQEERVRLTAAPVQQAVAAFVSGRVELVLGGTATDAGVALGANLPGGSLRFDPVAGLMGLVPARRDGLAADPELRSILDQALDRQALVSALGVPGLQPRASLLQPGLDGILSPHQPSWTALPLPERRAALIASAAAEVPEEEEEGAEPSRPVIRIALPAGPGGTVILARLKADWEPLGLAVEAAEGGAPADFRFIDEVAPSSSPAWFLRRFRCEFVPVCSGEADQLLDAARLTGFPPQRSQFFADAERIMREAVLFIPIAAPVRWSLAGRDVEGFAVNRFGRHTLAGLRMAPSARN
jgi:peptide/nickel transport system substrate-binding protein